MFYWSNNLFILGGKWYVLLVRFYSYLVENSTYGFAYVHNTISERYGCPGFWLTETFWAISFDSLLSFCLFLVENSTREISSMANRWKYHGLKYARRKFSFQYCYFLHLVWGPIWRWCRPWVSLYIVVWLDVTQNVVTTSWWIY